MILEINNKQAGMDQDVLRKVNHLLRFSLSRFEGVVSLVKARFFDVNGPKGGTDKRCRVSVKLRKSGQVVVLGEGSSFFEALNNCLGRLVRATRREIDRRRTKPIRKNRRKVHLAIDQYESEKVEDCFPSKIEEQLSDREMVLFNGAESRTMVEITDILRGLPTRLNKAL